MKRRIKIVDGKTDQHLENLVALGYEGEVVDDHFHIEVEGVLEDEVIDMTSKEKRDEVLKHVIQNKLCFSYSTRFLFSEDPEASAVFGGVACGKLGAASMLVMKKMPKSKKKKAAGLDIDALKAIAGI